MLRASAVLQDVWEPKKADRADPQRRRQLHDGLDAVPDGPRQDRRGSGHRRAQRCAPSCAPAHRSPARWSSRRARSLGTKIVSAWGMTENGAVTLIKLDDDDQLAFTTDGCPLPGVEVKVVDDERPRGAGRRGGQAAGARRAPTSAATCSRPQLNNTDAARLVRHRRPGAHRRARLHPHQRAQQGRDHPRRREHPRGRDRGAAVPASRRGAGGHRRLPRRAPRRTRLRGAS